ncbi:UDP-N-acetyl-D-galactosamine [Cryptosporidium ryanae]|uniref:UDP-N-acetyl-D-galactosamine n=1 Tax=Cryptosporidium ryanae TaxID=515981 RepID=UPI003519F503|nr:UDP-N-acetyl-D-galactosamine [Cryptosporidium ryanae]
MKLSIFIGLFYISLCVKITCSSFVFGAKNEDSQTLPNELIKNWISDNKYGRYYTNMNMFTVVILPDCDNGELLETTIKSLILTSNRNLIHEIIVPFKPCIHTDSLKWLNEFKSSPLNGSPVNVVETELQELGDIQKFAGSIATGDILLFVPTATLFPRNWMSIIMRNLSDNFNTISVPNFTILRKDSWKFSTNDLIFSPKMMFSKKDFEIFNLHNSNYDIPMFFSPIFAVKKIWWENISRLSDPMINMIFKEKINLDIGLRTWGCGGRVVRTHNLTFGITKIETSQPSLEVRELLIESWINKDVAETIIKNSDKLRNFINTSSNYVFEGLIKKRNEIIEKLNCDSKNFFVYKFENELYDIGAFSKETTQIELKNSNLCLTVAKEENNNSASFNIELSKCIPDNYSQSFYIDNKSKFIFFYFYDS